MIFATLLATCLPALAQFGSYLPNAKIAYRKNGTIAVTADSRQPLLQALTALSRQYGWVVDDEIGVPSARQVTGGPHGDRIGGAFQAVLPEPRAGSEASEAATLQRLITAYNQRAGGIIGPRFRLVHRPSSPRYDVVSTSDGTPLLDTPIHLPRADRTIDGTILAIFFQLEKSHGVKIGQGGLADSELLNRHVTVGGSRARPAREFLVRALDRTRFEREYVFEYSPSMQSYVLTTQVASIAARTATGETRDVLIPNPLAEYAAFGQIPPLDGLTSMQLDSIFSKPCAPGAQALPMGGRHTRSWNLRQLVARADVVVLGRAGPASSYGYAHGKYGYSLRLFRIEAAMKNDSPAKLRRDSTIMVARGSRALRVGCKCIQRRCLSFPDFHPGGQYLLFLRVPPQTGVFLVSQWGYAFVHGRAVGLGRDGRDGLSYRGPSLVGMDEQALLALLRRQAMEAGRKRKKP